MMLASCLLLGVEARLAKTDAVLLFACVAAMGALGRAYMTGQDAARAARMDAHPWRLPLIFWTALAAGILLKGPLILMFVGLCAVMLVTLGRSFGWLGRLKPLPGLAWMLLLVLPWFVAIVAKSGDTFFAESLGRDLFAKIGSGQESHGAPPGTYVLLFWVTFFPGAMLLPLVAPAVWRARGEPGTRFLLAWIVPAWIALEIVVTKLPHYVLPLYPAIAILIAGAVDAQVALARQRWLAGAPAWWFIFAVLGAVGTVVLHVMVGQQAGVLAWPFLVAAIIVALFAWWLLQVDGVETALLRAIAATLLFCFALFGMTLSAIPRLFPAQELAKFVRFTAKCDDPQVATAGYHEPSLVFLTGTSLRHASSGADAADFLKQGGCRFAFVESRQERAFAQRAEAIGLRYTRATRIDGINISGGRPIVVTVFRTEPMP
jgi:4-amino-4-deoxy-L-arabinose transferase-like glycosyltransferase